MDYSILTSKPDLVLINKKKGTWHEVDFDIPVNEKMKVNESEIDRQIPGLCRRAKSASGHEPL